MKRIALTALLLALGAATAQAHDTWFEPQGDGTLALGTGTLFPKRESGIGTEYLRQHGCRRTDGRPAALAPLDNTDDALMLAAPPDGACWMQLTPFEIDLPADKIAIYLDEVRPPKALLDAWADMHARGLPWHERYTKHARIERPGVGAPLLSDMDMDVLLDSRGQLPRVGQPLAFQVLRDGAPLADFAVELRSDSTRVGFWRRTDAEGRVQFQPPLPGRWILRAVDLRLSTTRPDTFDSRFITLAFTVATKTSAP